MLAFYLRPYRPRTRAEADEIPRCGADLPRGEPAFGKEIAGAFRWF